MFEGLNLLKFLSFRLKLLLCVKMFKESLNYKTQVKAQ